MFPSVDVALLAVQCHLVSPTQSFCPSGMVPAMCTALSFSWGWVWSLSSAMPQWRTEKSIHTSRQGQICLFSVADWYTAFTLQLLEHRDIFPSNLPPGWWSLWEGRAGVSCSFSAPSTTCQRSSKLAVVHISGRHWGPAVPSVLLVTLRISPAVLHLGSGAAFSIWVWLHG